MAVAENAVDHEAGMAQSLVRALASACCCAPPLIPSALAIDTFDGNAWVGVTPFQLDMIPRGIPFVLSHFEELNCRTYVVTDNKPGIFFFSLDAASRLAVWAARTFYLLPYFSATMSARKQTDGTNY
jgi:uncharacterized protein YqjF (DUF2071 family)